MRPATQTQQDALQVICGCWMTKLMIMSHFDDYESTWNIYELRTIMIGRTNKHKYPSISNKGDVEDGDEAMMVKTVSMLMRRGVSVSLFSSIQKKQLFGSQ